MGGSVVEEPMAESMGEATGEAQDESTLNEPYRYSPPRSHINVKPPQKL